MTLQKALVANGKKTGWELEYAACKGWWIVVDFLLFASGMHIQGMQGMASGKEISFQSLQIAWQFDHLQIGTILKGSVVDGLDVIGNDNGSQRGAPAKSCVDGVE